MCLYFTLLSKLTVHCDTDWLQIRCGLLPFLSPLYYLQRRKWRLPDEEIRLSAAARRNGLAPEEWLKQIALESLPDVPDGNNDEIDSKLRQRQERDGTALAPDVPARTLFAQWAEEDAQMTDEEREAEDRLWKEIEEVLAANRGVLQLKRLSG